LMLLFVSAQSIGQTPGCTDSQANNYNPSALQNDGTCTYDATTLSPIGSYNLSSNLTETSGLIYWNNQIWTHNDNDDINLYALDTLAGELQSTISLTGTLNQDWEEISQDENYLYVGDFGNNSTGNRTNLHILRIEKNSVLANSPIIDTIFFNYSNQTDFTATSSNNTDFDCEAFIATADSIYLFTKQWVSNKTNIYSLPKSPGNYVANLSATHDVQGLITGAVYLADQRIIVLSGYNNVLQPFLYLLFDFQSSHFFEGNKRKINLQLSFHQIEGIASAGNGLKYYASNEYFTQAPFVTVPQKLHIIDLSTVLGQFLNPLATNIKPINSIQRIRYNQADESIEGEFNQRVNYKVQNLQGQILLNNTFISGKSTLNVSNLLAGIYFITTNESSVCSFKFMKN